MATNGLLSTAYVSQRHVIFSGTAVTPMDKGNIHSRNRGKPFRIIPNHLFEIVYIGNKLSSLMLKLYSMFEKKLKRRLFCFVYKLYLG